MGKELGNKQLNNFEKNLIQDPNAHSDHKVKRRGLASVKNPRKHMISNHRDEDVNSVVQAKDQDNFDLNGYQELQVEKSDEESNIDMKMQHLDEEILGETLQVYMQGQT